MSDRNNRNYRQLRATLELAPADVVAAFRAIGVEVSGDRVRRWGRTPDAGSGRYSEMSDLEFDQFCAGVSRWTYEERRGETPTD